MKELSEEERKEKEEKLAEHRLESVMLGDGYYLLSNGKSVSFRAVISGILPKIMFLPQEEQEKVIEMNKKYMSVKGSVMMLERQLGIRKITARVQDWTKCMERSEEILDLFGKMFSGAEIHKIVTIEWGLKNVQYEKILKFQRDNSDVIDKMKDKYQNGMDQVRLVHKRSRLDELTTLYLSRKARYEGTGYKTDAELMIKLLEQIRKEAEGQVISINGQIKVEHEMAIQEHINRDIMKGLNINDIIIGRLCSRLKVNPKYILFRLHTSYYSKFTGFLPDSMGEDDEVFYPSQVVYDFDRIGELNKEIAIEDVQYTEVPEATDVDKAKKMKQLLLDRLKKKTESNKAQGENIKKIDGK